MATPLAMRVVEQQLQVFRKFWRGSLFVYVVNPLLFLGAIGIGLGGIIDEQQGAVEGVSYLAFLAPGMLAAAAMNGSANEALWPVMAGMKWIRTYHGMVSTPIGPTHVFSGLVIWFSIRAALGAALFLATAALLGAIPSWWGVLAVPAAVLCAAAFAAPFAAYAATQETDITFPVIMRLGIIPLFLFSGTFFPVSQLPDWLEPLRFLSPLWHGVELCRAATTGTGIGVGAAVVHVAVLVACTAAGWVWGHTTFTRRLSQ